MSKTLNEIIRSNWNLYENELRLRLKKLRRSWRYTDYRKIGMICANLETFKAQECYEDVYSKYGLKKIIDRYWKKYLKHKDTIKLTEQMQRETVMWPDWLLDKLEE